MKSKGNYPDFVYSRSGKLYKVVNVRDDNDETVVSRGKVSQMKRFGKQMTRFAEDVSDEELVIRDRKKQPVKKNLPSPNVSKKVKSATKVMVPKQAAEKKRKQPPPVEDDSSSESEDENDQEEKAILERLEKAKDELLTEEQLRELTLEEYKKKYRSCRLFIKEYEKKYAKRKKLEPWQRADKLFTEAAATLKKYKGLEPTRDKIDAAKSHLLCAIPKLRESGEKKYEEALEIIATLGKEDLDRFWAAQIRNANATCYDELISKKEYERKKTIEEAKATVAVMHNEPEAPQKEAEDS